ncbi:MAG: FCD domain-containing protein [Telmatospirillum sp.]|nr:FCD domain-containing protein [Telmatospirillum sp.]
MDGASSLAPDEEGGQGRHSAKTLIEFAYHTLRRDIIHGVLAPGSKLRIEQLRAQYEVGASTLREALTLLLSDALVTAEGQRGFRVAPVSMADFQDITRMRKLLECLALRESIEAGDDGWEAGVVAAFHRLSLAEDRLDRKDRASVDAWEDRNRAFHEALIAGCGSRWLHHFRGILYHQSERYRRFSLVNRGLGRDVHAEHHGIMEAALARDADLACTLTGEHIDRTLAAVVGIQTGHPADPD